MSPTDVQRIARDQAREELFDHGLYAALARRVPAERNRKLLAQLAEHERRHADFWLELAGVDERRVRPSRLKRALLLAARRTLGLTFIIKWLERGEEGAVTRYKAILASGVLDGSREAELRQIIADEELHEQHLEDAVGDERMRYLGAAVLGLNDALIELTGGLTGLAASIGDTTIIGFSGVVVGVAAALSMGASNFLSVDIGETSDLEPKRAAAYTGVAYLLVVGILVTPFFVTTSRVLAVGIMWAGAIVVIGTFSYYSAVVQEGGFKRRFTQMLLLGLGIGAFTFVLGRVLGSAFGIEV